MIGADQWRGINSQRSYSLSFTFIHFSVNEYVCSLVFVLAGPFSVNLSQWNPCKRSPFTLLWAFHWVNFTEIGPAFLSWPNFCELISVKHLQKGSPSTLLWSFHWESHTEKGPAGLQKYIFYFTNCWNKNMIKSNFIWLWQLSRLKYRVRTPNPDTFFHLNFLLFLNESCIWALDIVCKIFQILTFIL